MNVIVLGIIALLITIFAPFLMSLLWAIISGLIAGIFAFMPFWLTFAAIIFVIGAVSGNV